MSGLWKLIERLVHEAEAPKERDFAVAQRTAREDLLRYIERKYGENEKDEFDERMSQAQEMVRSGQMKFKDFRQSIANNYVDPKIDDLLIKFAKAGRPEAEQPKKKAGPALRPKGKFVPREKPTGDAPQRPDPSKWRPPEGQSYSVKPGERPAHAVGTAGQHQPKPKQTDVGDGPRVAKGNENQSGVVLAQREVDKLHGKGEKRDADRLAVMLGIPTTDQRRTTNRHGEEVVQIWGPDRIVAWADRPEMAQRGDLAEPFSRVDLIKLGVSNQLIHQLYPEHGRGQGGEHEPAIDTNKPLKAFGKHEFRPGDRGPIRQIPGLAQKVRGQSSEKTAFIPDKATGNFVPRKYQSNPEKSGTEMVYDPVAGKRVTAAEFEKNHPENPQVKQSVAAAHRARLAALRQAHDDASTKSLLSKAQGSPALQAKMRAAKDDNWRERDKDQAAANRRALAAPTATPSLRQREPEPREPEDVEDLGSRSRGNLPTATGVGRRRPAPPPEDVETDDDEYPEDQGWRKV